MARNLVQEIEEAAMRYKQSPVHTTDEWVADILVDATPALAGSWWPRIRAALLAAEEMNALSPIIDGHLGIDKECPFCAAQRRFRAAFSQEGKE